MAKDTNKDLRNKVIYQIFVRNFSEEGTFIEVQNQLDKIRELGTDIIWLMPIHPIGKKNRKGTLGSPYAISDYRSINPEFGDMDDFIRLTKAIHEKGMKCIIDVVYNHTSPDSVLAAQHPEWFFHRKDGSFGNRVGDWSDIIDLDYSNKELWDYQIETLKMWAKYVDGFRCDVAPMIPIEFWELARKEVAGIRPDCIWLSESLDPDFIMYLRSIGLTAHSDCEMYTAYDISYEYDCYNDFRAVLTGGMSLKDYAAAMNRQEYIYPENYVKLRFLENHDQLRAAFLIPDAKRLRNWTAFNFFKNGTALIYNGQEKSCSHLPDLFDKDTVNWECSDNEDLTELIKKLSVIKHMKLLKDSRFFVTPFGDSFLTAKYSDGINSALGVFSVKGESAAVPVEFPDGFYTDLISGSKTEVSRGIIVSQGEPVIIFTEGKDNE